MKQFFLISSFLCVTFITNAQSDKYTVAMQKNIVLIDSAKTNNQLAPLVSNFERIGDAEKTEWLPYYYAALCQLLSIRNSLQQGAVQKDATGVEAMISKADVLIAKAESLDKPNAEIFVLKNMLATDNIMINPMINGQKYGPLAAEYLTKAAQLDANNPRPVLMAAMAKYYTPVQWGGDKKQAALLFTKADQLDKAFKPASTLHPTWGKHLIDEMLKLSQEAAK